MAEKLRGRVGRANAAARASRTRSLQTERRGPLAPDRRSPSALLSQLARGWTDVRASNPVDASRRCAGAVIRLVDANTAWRDSRGEPAGEPCFDSRPCCAWTDCDLDSNSAPEQ